MKIKKHGILNDIKEIDFVCRCCDCEFSVEKWEMDFEIHIYASSRREVRAIAECPECHLQVNKIISGEY